MSSLQKLLLVVGGALLTFGLLHFLSGDRGRATRSEREAEASTPSARDRAAELAAPQVASDSAEALASGAGSAARSQLPAAEAATSAATGAFLRVLDGDGQSALANLTVKFVLGETPALERRHAVAASDTDGVIDLAVYTKESPSDAAVFAFPMDCRLRFEPRVLTLADLGRTRAQAPRLVLVARPSARLRGRALDATSGAPLADVALRVFDWHADPADDEPAAQDSTSEWTSCRFERESAAWMVTDAEGRFEAAEPFTVGRLRLMTPHEERADVVLDASGTPVEARLALGPVILLDFRAPGERKASDFIAGLYRDPSEAGLEEQFFDPTSPWTPADWDPGWGNAAAVRAGSPPWTRLAEEELEQPLPSFLILVSRDGAAKGAARIDEFERYRHEPLFVEVQEIGALSGRVRMPPDQLEEILRQGKQPIECEIELWTADAAEDADPIGSRWVTPGASFCFQGIPAGPYRLVLNASGCEPRTLRVNVPTPEPLDLLVTVPASQEQHTFDGRITSASGLALDGQDGRAHVNWVWMSAPRLEGRSAQVTWNGGVGTFRVDGLNAAEYRVHPRFGKGMVDIEPARPTVSVPGPTLELRARDDVPLIQLELWILVPEPASELEIEARLEGTRPQNLYESVASWGPLEALPDGRPAQRALLGPYPSEAFASLTVSGEGLITARLAREQFVVTGDLWRAEIGMVAGWSARIQITDEAGDGVPGVVLAMDGVLLEPSDAYGRLAIDRESKPTRLSVVTPGWELVEHHSWDDWGTVFENGEFTLEQGRLDVFLRRKP